MTFYLTAPLIRTFLHVPLVSVFMGSTILQSGKNCGDADTTVNSCLADTQLLRTLAITDTKRRPEGVRYNERWLYIVFSLFSFPPHLSPLRPTFQGLCNATDYF